jgi:hypothetical protein
MSRGRSRACAACRAAARRSRLRWPSPFQLARKREISLGTDRHVQAVAIELAALASRYSRTMTPHRGPRTRHRSVPAHLGSEALSVCVRGHVGGIDSHVPSEQRVLLLERPDSFGYAPVEKVRVVTELRREAIASIHRRDIAVRSNHSGQRGVLTHERDCARPGTQRLHSRRTAVHLVCADCRECRDLYESDPVAVRQTLVA